MQFTGGQRASRVRITAGNGVLGAHDLSADLVALDDFIYAEPSAVVPAPASVVLLVGVLSLLAMAYWRKAGQHALR